MYNVIHMCSLLYIHVQCYSVLSSGSSCTMLFRGIVHYVQCYSVVLYIMYNVILWYCTLCTMLFCGIVYYVQCYSVVLYIMYNVILW